MNFTTADLCDAFGSAVHPAAPLFREFGGAAGFCGPIATVQVSDDNALVREALETAGRGRVLVVDGGGSTRCALLGGRLAQLAHANGWAGVVINGCVRDSSEIARRPSGCGRWPPCRGKAARRAPGRRTYRWSSPGSRSPRATGCTPTRTASWWRRRICWPLLPSPPPPPPPRAARWRA